MDLKSNISTLSEINERIHSYTYNENSIDINDNIPAITESIMADIKDLNQLYSNIKDRNSKLIDPIPLDLKQFKKITEKDNEQIKNDGFLFYGMRDVSKSNNLFDVYKKFPYFNIVIRRINTKFNQRVFRLIYNCPSMDDNKYQQVNNLVEQDLSELLYKNQYQNLAFLLTHIFHETLLYGVSYIYYDEDKILTTLSQKDLRVLYNFDGITYNPQNYLQRVFLSKEYWDTVKSFQSLYVSYAQESAFVAVEENPSNFIFNRLNLNNFNMLFKNTKTKNIFKLLDADKVHPCYFFPYENDLYVQSPLELLEKDITEYTILDRILKETQNAMYGNQWFIFMKDLTSSVKNLGTVPIETIKLLQRERGKGQKKLIDGLKTTSHIKNQTCASEIIEDIKMFEKDSEVRKTLLIELDRIVDRILDSVGVTGYSSSENTNKRNENIQMVEAEDFYTGVLHSYDILIKKIYRNILSKRLKEFNIPEDEIDFATKTLKIFYDENAILTLEDQLKLTQTLNATSEHLTSREFRDRIGFNFNADIEDRKIRKSEAEITALENGKKPSNESKESKKTKEENTIKNLTIPENQYGKKNPSNATINK